MAGTGKPMLARAVHHTTAVFIETGTKYVLMWLIMWLLQARPCWQRRWLTTQPRPSFALWALSLCRSIWGRCAPLPSLFNRGIAAGQHFLLTAWRDGGSGRVRARDGGGGGGSSKRRSLQL